MPKFTSWVTTWRLVLDELSMCSMIFSTISVIQKQWTQTISVRGRGVLSKILSCVPLGWSGSGSVIRDHFDHRTSKKPDKSTLGSSKFILPAMSQVISDHWSWSGSSQRNAPLSGRLRPVIQPLALLILTEKVRLLTPPLKNFTSLIYLIIRINPYNSKPFFNFCVTF